MRPTATVRGARRAPGPTTERARGTKSKPTSFPTPAPIVLRRPRAPRATSFIRRGRSVPTDDQLLRVEERGIRVADVEDQDPGVTGAAVVPRHLDVGRLDHRLARADRHQRAPLWLERERPVEDVDDHREA